MSYIMDTIQCPECKKYMNVAFGIVGSTQVAQWPTKCAFCDNKDNAFIKVSAMWHADKDGNYMEKDIHSQVLDDDEGTLQSTV